MSTPRAGLLVVVGVSAVLGCTDMTAPAAGSPSDHAAGTPSAGAPNGAGAGGATPSAGGAATNTPAAGGASPNAGAPGSAGMGGSTPEPEPEPGDASFLEVAPSATALGLYETLDVKFRSSTPYDNPFDPDDIRADLVALAPDGATVVMPAFFESGSPGDATWRARFTPRGLGRFTYRLQITRDGQPLRSDQQRLEVGPSTRDGFLHLAPDNFYNLVFDSGRRFRGVGENYGWETDKYKFADMMPRLKGYQVNFIRTWEGPGRYALQHGQALSHFAQAVAAKLDQTMALARDNGIYVMSALEPAIYFLTTPHGGDQAIQWSQNPFSAAQGGPCQNTADFFTNAEAKRHYRNKLRYSIARWGADPHLAVWELWNEFDHLVEQLSVPTSAIAAWHQEMGAYLHETDPYGRIVTTSLSHNDYADLWSLPEMQFTQRHLYGSMDGILDTHRTYETKYQKPFVAGEFSFDWRWPLMHTPAEYGREVHMAMWRGIFGPTPILPMTWWWDFHADNNHYFHFAHVSTLSQKTAEGPGPLEPQPASATNGLEVLSVRSPAGCAVWVHNKGGGAVSGASVNLTTLPASSYALRSFNTWTGAWGEPQTVSPGAGSLSIALPTLAGDADLAFWLDAP